MIVSGAGPVGCIAAKVLADAGYAILLAEKSPVPREKSCSGILIEKSVGLIDTFFGKIPRSVLSVPHQIKGMMVTTEAGKRFTFERMGLNVWRSLLDYWLVLETTDAGAEFRERTEVSGYREEEDRIVVTLRDGTVSEESARILIGCDGVASIVRRTLRRRQADYLTTYQTCAKGSIDLDPEYYHLFFQHHLSEYDAWCTVKDEYIVAGVAVHDPNTIPKYRARFLSYLKSEFHADLAAPSWEELGMMSRIAPENPVDLGEGRVFLAGDAANLFNPMAEGISTALMSGYACADAVIRSGTSGDDIDVSDLQRVYEGILASGITRMRWQWKHLVQGSDRLSYLRHL